MLKKLMVGLVVVLLCVGASVPRSPRAAAHVLKQNNGVTAVMHITPFDDPAAGEPTKIEFEYGSNNGSFSLANYQVSLQLTDTGRLIAHQAVPPAYFGSAAQGAATINFPAIGVYTLVLTGTSNNPDSPNFQMRYDIRVAKVVGATTAQSNSTIPLLVSVTALVVLVMLAVRQVGRGGRYTSVASSKSKVNRGDR